MHFVVKTTLDEQTERDFILFHRENWEMFYGRKFWKSYKLVLETLVAAALAAILQNSGLGVFLILLAVFIEWMRQRRHFHKDLIFRHRDCTISFDDAFILAATGQMQTRIAYADIGWFYETERFFYLYTKAGKPYLLGKSGFILGAVADFGGFIATRSGCVAKRNRRYMEEASTFLSVQEKSRWVYQLAHPAFIANTITVRANFWRFILSYNGQKAKQQGGVYSLQDDSGRQRRVRLFRSRLSAWYLQIDDEYWQITPQPSLILQAGVFMMMGCLAIGYLATVSSVMMDHTFGDFTMMFNLLFSFSMMLAAFVCLRVLLHLLFMYYAEFVKLLLCVILPFFFYVGAFAAGAALVSSAQTLIAYEWRWRTPDCEQSLPVACYTVAGIAVGALGWPDGAAAIFDNALERAPQAAELYFNRAIAHKKLGDTAAILIDLDRAIAHCPTFAAAHVQRGILREKATDTEGALYSYALAMDCKNDIYAEEEALYRRGMLYMKLRHWANAMADFDKAIALRPQGARLYKGRAYVFAAQGNYEAAIEDYGVAVREENSGSAFYARGLCYGKSGQYEKSVRDLTAAIERDSGKSSYYYNRGLSYSMLGENESAIEDYRKAIELEPDGKYYVNLGICYDAVGQIEQALTSYAKAIELDPRDAAAYYNRGVYYSSTANYAHSIADYDRVIALDPANGKAYNNRGDDYFNLGQYDRALEDFSKAIELTPEDGRCYLNRSIAYRKIGRVAEANEDYRRAVTLEPELRNEFVEKSTMEKKR